MASKSEIPHSEVVPNFVVRKGALVRMSTRFNKNTVVEEVGRVRGLAYDPVDKEIVVVVDALITKGKYPGGVGLFSSYCIAPLSFVGNYGGYVLEDTEWVPGEHVGRTFKKLGI
jgi:hypothetical protein